MTGTYREGQCEFLDELLKLGKFLTMNEFAKKKKIERQIISKFENILEFENDEFIILFCFYNVSSLGSRILLEEYYLHGLCYRTMNWDIQVQKNDEKKAIIALYSRRDRFCYLIISHYDLSDFFERNKGLITKEDFLPEEQFLLKLL